MIDPRSTRFWRLAMQTGLLGEADLQASYAAIAPHKRSDADALERRIARQAISSGKLTLWQAQQLLNNRTLVKVDRYVLLELLGQGGMGRVYLARDTRLGRRVAIKLLSPQRMESERAIARFQREARAGAQLQHENLVRVFDQGDSDGRPYLVMEYIEGRNAGQIVGELGAFAPGVAARLVRQVALALDHARLNGLIHRDVNPYNILVTRDGTAKLTDLGLALDLAEETPMTVEGATVGTFDYISPEQARHSRSVDTRSDIYSLGCTLFHLVTGRVPFPATSMAEKLYAHQVSSPEPITDLVPDAPEGLAAIARKMMEKDPNRRYSTPLEVARALELYADDDRTPAPSSRKSRVHSGSSSDTVMTDAPTTSSAGELVGVGESKKAAKEAAGPRQGQASQPQAAYASDADLMILPIVDTGPDEPLMRRSGGSSSSRSRIRIPEKAASLFATPAARIAGASALVILGLGALLLLRPQIWKPPAKPPVGRQPVASAKPKPKAKTEPSGPVEAAAEAPAIAVRWTEGGTTRESAHADLREAMVDAVRYRGEVILREGRALEFSVGTGPTALAPEGALTIRAEQGHRPTLILRVEGPTPFLSTRPQTRLKLVGLTIHAAVTTQVNAKSLIHAQGDVELERCTLIATRSPRGFAALWGEGMSVRIVGCFFHGFDQPLRLTARPGSKATLSRSIVIALKANRRETAPESGWAIHATYEPRGGGGTPAARGARLSLDHSTIAGNGVLSLSRFGSKGPIAVEAEGLAVQARSLIAWRDPTGPENGGAPAFAPGLTWVGRDNAYALVDGPPWVEHNPGDPRATGAPNGLKAWSEGLAPGSETGARQLTLAFKPRPGNLAPDEVDPVLYDLTPESAGMPPAGASSADIGPDEATANAPDRSGS